MCRLLVLLVWMSVSATSLWGTTASDTTVPPGFEISLFADDDLAHDVHCLTIDSHGRVVVSGPGYIRILLDQDDDEIADGYQTFAEGPQTGAQGMYFDGSDLYCTGDGGLLHYQDRDEDGLADGPPDILMPLKTGGEHYAHSIQKGPDGWWYLLLGNLAQMTERDVTRDDSPISQPHNGVLVRLPPDFSGCEVIADGFRNPYDFSFTACGEILTFDSDDERDVSLPWYRPTRLFQVLPGYHAGWVTTSWKRPDDYPDMPPVVSRGGRGSPTGVVSYRHHGFPEQYQNAIFALDWTFGRLLAIPLHSDGAALTGVAESFLTTRGQFGFAATDLEVTPAGDLMVSVGGRGTRGGVYRIHWVGHGGGAQNGEHQLEPAAPADPLLACLAAPQPLASWSRARWVPIAQRLGKAAFVAAAQDRGLAVPYRVRAVEIVTELFDGLAAETAATIHSDPAPCLRARVAWSLGRQPGASPSWDVLSQYVDDVDPHVARVALEACLRVARCEGIERVLPATARRLSDPDRYVRHAAARVVARGPDRLHEQVLRQACDESLRAEIALRLALIERPRQVHGAVLARAVEVLTETVDPSLTLEAIRLAQLALGDVGGGGPWPPVYDGYANGHAVQPLAAAASAALESRFPTGSSTLDHELARLIALLAIDSPVLVERLVQQLTDQSDPVDDIHYLIVLSRLATPRSDAQRRRMATALVGIESKVESRGLHQDSNWEVRVAEMYQQLVQQDPQLPQAVVHHAAFGRPGHLLLARGIDPGLQAQAAARIVDYLDGHSTAVWTGAIVAFVAQFGTPDQRARIREKFADLSLQGAVLRATATSPHPQDRPWYVHGLTSPDWAILRAAVTALERLPAGEDAEEQFALLQALRRLGSDPRESRLRSRITRLLQHNLGPDDDFESTHSEYDALAVADRWTEYLRTRFPAAADHHLQSARQQETQLRSRLESVDWDAGDAARGKLLFHQQSCASCHSTRTAVGPDLTGVTQRFSRDDVFTATLFPNRDVSPQYHTVLIETTRGHVISGVVIYESVDGLTLRDSTNQTIRVASGEIDSRRELDTSLMPDGLLDGLSPENLADLYAYLQTL